MRGSGLVFVIALLFVGCLAVGQCRPVVRGSHQESHANITANATTIADSSSSSRESSSSSKLTNWCYPRDCNNPNNPFYTRPCYCCPLRPDELCFSNIDDCHAGCPTCHPTC
ncbi:hypothetical protein CFC21_094463 [Triticum aestivum]|uniref:Bowman-Birk serine protease inhibitors family domain-containing protein n=2 Tax=Triticum aestivum TaxID=4565 RepID=A0A9R1LN53_WHEAT|nr:hypothetical protein CFC21_094463 [Triticum aestivum]